MRKVIHLHTHVQVLKATPTQTRPSLTVGDVAVESDGRLVGPAARHVAYGVPSAPQQQQGDVITPDEVNTLRMAWKGGRGGEGGGRR